MPQQENDIKHYGAEDLERYHSGKMTEQEMHALEKAALDDPFLSDALDGYRYTNTATADINELKNKLLQQGHDKKVVGFNSKMINRLLKVAAVLILFSGLGWLLYNNNNPKQQEIAAIKDNKNEIPVIDTAVTNTATDLMVVVPVDEKRQDAPTLQQKKVTEKLTIKKDTIAVSDVVVVSSGATGFSLNQNSVTATSDSARDTKAYYYTTAQSEWANNAGNVLAGKTAGINAVVPKQLRGRITDSKGNPVSFANVVDKKNNMGVQADMQGSFAFTTLDSAPKVEVNAVGYKGIIQALSNDSAANNLVLLEQDNKLQEVVVTSAFQTKRTMRSLSSTKESNNTFKDVRVQRVTVTNAVPVNGWQNFNTYVNDSLKTILQLGQSAVSAEVIASFDINDKGEPVDINVTRSLCTPCDAEAIRIIKNAPPLKLNKKRKKAHAVVKF